MPKGFHAHGWTLVLHPSLLGQLEKLFGRVERESGAARERLPELKLIRAVGRLIFHDVPQDPGRREYRQGHTLGDGRKHWFRAKFANGRFRLFFRFRSDVRLIVFAWMNDEHSLRTYGSRTDAYAVFGRMLDDGNPPDDWDALLATATTDDAVERARRVGAAAKLAMGGDADTPG